MANEIKKDFGVTTVFKELPIITVSSDHNSEDFDCGEPARNVWLCNRALSNQRSDDTRTYVAAEGVEIFGFYALAVSSIVRDALPSSMRRNAPDPVSCVLLAQLGVDLRYQQHGIGRQLVLHAMAQATRIAELAGCRLFAVSPSGQNLVPYYRRYGFVETQATPPLMTMHLQKVRATLAAVADTKAAHNRSDHR